MPPSGGGQPYPASRDMTTPFPFGCLPAVLWDINPKEMGSLGAMEPAVEDTDGRSASDRTRPRFFFFGLCSTRSPPYRGTGFRYRIRLLPGLACGILPDGTIPWLLNRDFKWSTQELDVRRGSVYGEILESSICL